MMEPRTTIQRMLAGNIISVPAYQRAYSWDTPGFSGSSTQTDVFLSDLEAHRNGTTQSPYYFGHFLFEKQEREPQYKVIDGQQRLTTIVIFLAALFRQIEQEEGLSDYEAVIYEDIIKRRNTIRFKTVHYDNQLFIDYVIENTKKDHNGLETESSRRIVRAYDYFAKQLKGKNKDYLLDMLKLVASASCTTHVVRDEPEAIQMFLFQNNRGKRPTNLEVLKAQFMHYVQLNGENDTETLIGEIQARFERIYQSIAIIENQIHEDDILVYTQRVFFNSLWEDNSLDRIETMLRKRDQISFIKDFSAALARSFEVLAKFVSEDENKHFAIHSLLALGRIGFALPFIIKAYIFDLPHEKIVELAQSLESLLLRHRIIATRAELASRLQDVFVGFTEDTKDIAPITEKINSLKKADNYWLAYWNDENLESALQGELSVSLKRYLLWKYENYLKAQGHSGYTPARFDTIYLPEVEHIAPQTEPTTKPHGYGKYDDEFYHLHINSLGNSLLISKSHNCAVGNKVFPEKWETYIHNEQQREIQKMLPKDGIWDQKMIQKRQQKIIQALMEML